MPKPKNIEELKIALEKILGARIQYGYQCQELSNEIKILTQKNISAQTIRRICGLLPYQGQLRPFTYSAISEFIDIKLWNKKNKPHSGYNRKMILQLLISIAEQHQYLPESLQSKSQLEWLRFLYHHLKTLSPSLLEIIQSDSFMNLWWYYTPPMDILNHQAKRWILPLRHAQLLPQKRRYMESFYFQSQWLSQQNIRITEKECQNIQKSLASTSGIERGRLLITLWWNWKQNKDQDALDDSVAGFIKKWERQPNTICTLEQYQIIENLCLLNRFADARRVSKIKAASNKALPQVYNSLLNFWESILGILEGKRGLQNQNLFLQHESHLFFAPKFYELVFIQSILRSKYLRDFHQERYIKRREELIIDTKYTYLREWPQQD